MTGLFGGAFDPPHNGHVTLAEAAMRHFALERLVVLVSATPGHKAVELDPQIRLRLARAAFPEYEVELDPYPRTIDLLRARAWPSPIFLIGADQFCNFLSWKEPDEVLARTRLGVATRPGFPRGRLDAVLSQLRRPERVELFEIEPLPISSHELRARVAAGEPIAELVPPAVARLIAELDLYRRD